MRPTPPFDPRAQQGTLYSPVSLPVPLKPKTNPNTFSQHSYPQAQHYSQPLPVPPYTINPPYQLPPQHSPNPAPTQLPSPSSLLEVPRQQQAYPQVIKIKPQEQQKQIPKFDEEADEDQQTKSQQIIIFWQHKFSAILQKFQLVFEKVERFHMQFQNLNEQLKAVDSQQEWNQAKKHHEEYMEQLEEFTQQIAGVISENTTLMEQTEGDGNDQLIWKQRYFQLFQGYKNMEQELLELKENKTNYDHQDTNKLADLMNNYRELQREYSQTVNELAELKKLNIPTHDHDTLSERANYAIEESQKYKAMLEALSKENEQLEAANAAILEQKKMVEESVKATMQNNITQDYQEFKRAINERDEEIHILNKQLQVLSQKYNFLVDTHNSLQNQFRQDSLAANTKLDDIQHQLQQKSKQCNETKNKIGEIQARELTVISISQELQRQLKVKANELQEKADEVDQVRKQMAATVSQHKNESEKELIQCRKDYDIKIQQIEEDFEERLQGFKKKLKKKEEQSENAALLNIKIESLDKKNRVLLGEIETLTKQINNKDKEIMEIKRFGNSQERLKELEGQCTLVTQEKEHLSLTLSQKKYEIEGLQAQLKELETKVKETNSKLPHANTKPLFTEIEQLSTILQTKQSQISKHKTNMALKDGIIKDLQSELQKTKNGVIQSEKNQQLEKSSLQENVKMLQRKNHQNQLKMKNLQFEFGSLMKKNLEEEIKNLRSQNQSRQQTIIRLQADQLELRSRLSHYERVRSTHNNDIDELRIRIKQLQTSKFEMLRKVETSFRDVKNKEKEFRELALASGQLKSTIQKLEGELFLNEKLIKDKDKIIEELEGQVIVAHSRLNFVSEQHESLKGQHRQDTDNFLKQLEQLKHQILEFEHDNLSRKQFKEKFSAEITKIQNGMIEQLRTEKELLQSELAAVIAQLGTPLGNSTKTSVWKSKQSESIEYIQKRLFEFNCKIDDIIVKNRQIGNREFGANRENVNMELRQSTIREHEEQINSLKSQVQQLTNFIAMMEMDGGGPRSTPHTQLILMEQQKAFKEKVEFYQNQTKELELRIENLLKLNSSLKERLDSLLKGDAKNSAAALYKEQLVLSEETIENLNTRVKRLLEENRGLKANSTKSTGKACREYEDKVFECENKILALQRKISSLELERTKGDNERATLQRTISSVQNELSLMKASAQKQTQLHEQTSKQLESQVAGFQGQIAELLGKVRMLESENSRLSEAMHTSYSQQHILLNTPVRNQAQAAPRV